MTANGILRLSLAPFRLFLIPIILVLDSVIGMISLIPLWSPIHRFLISAIWFPFHGYIRATTFLYREVFAIRPILALVSIPLLTGSDVLFAVLPSPEPDERSRKALAIDSWPSLPDDTLRTFRPLAASPNIPSKASAPAEAGTPPRNAVATERTNRQNPYPPQGAPHRSEGTADANGRAFGSCPTCGDIIRTNWERCPHCHDDLMPTASEGYRPEPLQNAPVYHGTERPLLRRAPIGRCECCNNVIREGEKRCRYCGGAVKQMPAPLSTHTGKVLPLNRQAILHCLDKSADKEALRISACPLCGDMVRIGWERCPRCGEPLDARLQFPVLRKDNPKSEATGKAP